MAEKCYVLIKLPKEKGDGTHILGFLLKLTCIKLHAFLDITHYYCRRRFVGAKMNTCYNCVDRHVEKGKGSQTALIYDSPLTGKVEMYSYQSLQDLVRMKLCYLQFWIMTFNHCFSCKL